jgi:hypothetical protein
MTDVEMHERLHKFRERHYTAQERENSSQFPCVICGPWIYYYYISSVSDPDPHVFGPPGSGSFYQQA